jgi:hypothetical protein
VPFDYLISGPQLAEFPDAGFSFARFHSASAALF